MTNSKDEKSTGTPSWQQYWRIAICGAAMGAADVIPGVSGGTVALVLGIYERLVTAISHVDAIFLTHFAARRWRAASAHIDLAFLVSLAFGLATGMIAMLLVIHQLMESEFARPLTLGAFFGMIAASAWIVGKIIRCRDFAHCILCLSLAVVAAAFAWWLTTLDLNAIGTPGLGYVFLCGMVAICAMILPGISGAHILLVLGTYLFITGIVRDMAHGQVSAAALLSLAVFACGCAVGLISFSKVLRWLLARFHAATMAVLCGFMIGALRKVWPFQLHEVLEVGGVPRDGYIPFLPTQFGGYEMLVAAVVIASFAIVLLVDWYARGASTPSAEQ